MKNLLFLPLSIFIFSATLTAQSLKIKPKYLTKANDLAHRFIIVDAHVDVPYRLMSKMEDISVQTPKGDFDYVRAKKGGLSAPIMSIYVPAGFQKTAGASKAYADTLIDLVNDLVKKNPEKFALANTPDEVEANFKKGLISFPMGMENGSPIEDKIENVAYFQKRGVRYITLTHSEDNLICASSYSLNNKWSGLSAFGKQVVEEMNRVGIMIDVSHVSDKTIEQVLEISKAPVIASHSSCRKYTPTLIRNLSDDLIKKIAAKGGVIHVNFSSLFLDSTAAKAFLQERQDKSEWLLKNNTTQKDPNFKAFSEAYDKSHPQFFSTLKRLADHIDHIKKLVGVDYIGFGSDFDGAGDSFPLGIKDVSEYPNLIAILLQRGYTEGDIEKICYKNTFRVWRAVESLAQKGH
jgi:membrane dipeptidase